MSIATDLTQVATNLNTALTTANAKITAKGGTASSTIYGLSTAIENLPSGGTEDGFVVPKPVLISYPDVFASANYTQYVFTSSVSEATNTTLTSSVNCSIGDTVVCCFAVRDSSTNFSVSSGWTMISYSNYLAEANTYQRLCWAYKTATSTTESITVTQSSSGKIYINLVAITPDSGQTISLEDNGFYINATDTTSNLVTKPSGLTIWGVTGVYAQTGTPWTASNNSFRIGLDYTTTACRLASFLDESDDSSVIFTNTYGTPVIIGSLTVTGITKFIEEVEL